jgi:preprotein translocase SecF subunit
MFIDIVKHRYIYFSISIIVILIGIGFMIFNSVTGKGAFNYDVQFIGGTSIEVDLGQTFDNSDVTALVKEATGETPQVQKVGNSGTTVTIKTKKLDDDKRDALKDALVDKYGIERDSIGVQEVSATLSKEMQKNAVISVLLACIAMLIYVSIRFREVKTGASCILALVHDSLVVLGSYAVFRIPMNSAFIAAVLTVVGYSINASVVIFDRIRENKKKFGRKNYTDLVNHSVNQTMRRSIFTSLTVFFTVACLYVFGVQSVREFALPIAVGVVAGAYSSIFISANLWYVLCTSFDKKKNN